MPSKKTNNTAAEQARVTVPATETFTVVLQGEMAYRLRCVAAYSEMTPEAFIGDSVVAGVSSLLQTIGNDGACAEDRDREAVIQLNRKGARHVRN